MKMIFRVNEEKKSFCFDSWSTFSSKSSIVGYWSTSDRFGWRRSLCWDYNERTSKFRDLMRGSGTSLLMI